MQRGNSDQVIAEIVQLFVNKFSRWKKNLLDNR